MRIIGRKITAHAAVDCYRSITRRGYSLAVATRQLIN